jgi:hypothetical protein
MVAMQLDVFIRSSHQKIIDHYRRLRDSAKSEIERERFQRRMDEACEDFERYDEQRAHNARRAA